MCCLIFFFFFLSQIHSKRLSKLFIVLESCWPLAQPPNSTGTKLQKKGAGNRTLSCFRKKASNKIRKQMKGSFSTVWSENSSFHSWLQRCRHTGREAPWKCATWCQMNKKVSHLHGRRRPICVDALFSTMRDFFFSLPFSLYFIWRRDHL